MANSPVPIAVRLTIAFCLRAGLRPSVHPDATLPLRYVGTALLSVSAYPISLLVWVVGLQRDEAIARLDPRITRPLC